MEKISDLQPLINNFSLKDKELFYTILSEFCSENKRVLFEQVINFRTRHLTIVLEDLYQSQNASATLRTSEIMGIQDVYIIENEHAFDINPDIVLGASKWINYIRFNSQKQNTLPCLTSLKEKGYTIAATLPGKHCIPIEELDISKKTALIFGCEKSGLSDVAVKEADIAVKIPMFGFTESYNISVSVAICLYEFTQRLRKSGINWQLTQNEKFTELIEWMRRSVKKPELLMERIIQDQFSHYLHTL